MASEPPSPDAVLQLAALHTLAATGFASTSRAASLTLSATLARYLHLVATACTDRAALSGRNKVAAIDVVQALEDLGVGGVEDLYEWTMERDKEETFRDAGLATLEEAMREGLGVDEAIAEMRLVSEDEFTTGEVDEEDVEEDLPRVKGMPNGHSPDNVKIEPLDDSSPRDLSLPRNQSPDMSWLPPLPGQDTQTQVQVVKPDPEHQFLPSPASTIAERYRKRIPFSQSQLGASRPFVEPSNNYPPFHSGPAPSSLQSLVEVYKATAGEPSIALRPSHLREQATDLLRRTIASPDDYSPEDTLISPLPPPRTTPIVPSHSESNTIPPHPLPLDPDRTGLLSSLVHQIKSPHLPPTLRDRLTSIRPPIPQKRLDGGAHILFGEPVKGPSLAALTRAKGKQPEAGEDEGLLRATWDSGPSGMEKWGRGTLPTGKKVVQSGQGESRPRLPPGTRAEDRPSVDGGVNGDGAARSLRVRLPSYGGEVSGSLNPSPLATPSGAIRLKLAGLRTSSVDAEMNSAPEAPGMSAPSPNGHMGLEPSPVVEMPNGASDAHQSAPGNSHDSDQPGASPAMS